MKMKMRAIFRAGVAEIVTHASMIEMGMPNDVRSTLFLFFRGRRGCIVPVRESIVPRRDKDIV